MNIFSKHKYILIGIVGLILIFFGYWYFILSKKSTQPQKNTGSLIKNTENTEVSKPATKSYDREFVSGLLSLNTIELNVSIFDSVAYKALSFPEKPFAVNYDLPYGRQNPFLPIGINGVSIFPAIVSQEASANNTAEEVQVIEPVSTTTLTASSTVPKPIRRTFTGQASSTRSR